jgi:glycosyltransferase 2 family protein
MAQGTLGRGVSAGGKSRRILWRVALAALLLFWIFHNIFTNEGRLVLDRAGVDWAELTRGEQWRAAWSHGPRELWETLSAVEPWAFLVSLGLMGSTILIGALRWHMALRVQGLALPFKRAGEISLIAHFFNSFLLGSTGGDLLKAYYAARETHHKKAEAVTTVFVDRLIGLFSMLLFAALMMPLNAALLGSHEALWSVTGFALAMLVASGGMVWLAFWGGVSRRFPVVRELLRRLPKAELLERSLEACRHYGRERAFLARSLAASMALNLVCVLQVWVLALGLGADVPLRALLVIVPVVICISAIPVTPSGLGVRENLFVLILSVPALGVSATHALSLSLLAYAGSLFWSVVGGAVYLGVKESEHLEEITAAPAGDADKA